MPRKTLRPHLEIVKSRDSGTGKVITLAKSKPTQLALFQTFFPADTEDYSNTIELYDAIPKYFSSQKRMAEIRKDGVFLQSLKRRFRHRDTWFNITIRPARLDDKDDNEKEYYPTDREGLVEEALKRIACDRLNGVFLNDIAGVQFTLYELWHELKGRKHDIHWDDLITSLKICRGTILELTSADGRVLVSSSIFPVLVLVNRHEWVTDPKHMRCYVQFNPLITQSTNQLTYRQFDYVTFMELKNHLARWLFKRLSHNYTQASMLNPYTIKLSTIVRDSALVNAKRMRDKVRYVDAALNELKNRAVLLHYKKESIEGERKRIEEVIYILTPCPEFTSQVKKANRRAREIIHIAFEKGVLSQQEFAERTMRDLAD